jgi:hypothetical protein
MAGGAEVQATIRIRGTEGPEDRQIRFTNLDPAITVKPAAQDGSLTLLGPTVFSVSIGSAARAGLHAYEVESLADPSKRGTWMIQIHPPVARFIVSQSPPVVGSSGPNDVTLRVVAVDERGLVVASFRGDVALEISGGASRRETVPGESFQNGAAEIVLRFDKPLSGAIRARAEAKQAVAGRRVRAQGQRDVPVKGRKAP